MTIAGVALRQWAIAALGEYLVGDVRVQPGQTIVSSGPLPLAAPSLYTGQRLEMIGAPAP